MNRPVSGEPPRYSVVVPVYESHDSLPELTSRLEKVFEEKIGAEFELIFVDDGSRDPRTRRSLETVADGHPRVRVLFLTRNFGKPAAILCGLEESVGEWVITMDDDLQHLPEELPRLIAGGEHDVVMAQFQRLRHGFGSRITSRIKSWFDRRILRLPVRNSPFKLIRGDIARAILMSATPRPFVPALLASVTDDIVAVTVEHGVSRAGPSRFGLRRKLRQFANLLIGNSSFALRTMGVLGILVAIVGFIYAAAVLFRVLFLDAEPPSGWASLMIAILILNGLILISTSLAGEYFIRLLENTSGRPLYVVRTRIGGPARRTGVPAPESRRAKG